MAQTAPTQPKMEITKHPEFRVIYVTGVFGSLKGDEGFMKFYLDMIEPKVKVGGQLGEMEIDKINREIQVELRMSSVEFVKMAKWMNSNIEELQKRGILTVEKKPEGTEAYRV